MTEISRNLVEEAPKILHDEALRIIEERGIGQDELATMLHVFPEGARRLLSQESWPAETGFRVLDALGVSVVIEVTIPSPPKQ